VQLRLEVPTVQGSAEHTPSWMTFEVTSTEYAEIAPFMERLRELVRANGLVWVNESKQ